MTTVCECNPRFTCGYCLKKAADRLPVANPSPKPLKGELVMKTIQQSLGAHNWPRKQCTSIEARKRDLIVRIADWSRDKDEPAFDVEVYIGGVYDWNQSKSFTKRKYGTMKEAKKAAVAFSSEQIAKLL